jgi:hypothetical protein
VETGVRAYGVGIEAAAALGDHSVEVSKGREVLIGDWLVHERPQPLSGL